ncbi:MAG: ArsR/SmtB family transcription factor [Steroidobacter sp.]
MSSRIRSAVAKRQAYAPIFAALGDATRLALIAKLGEGRPCSIAQLTEGTQLTRQAVTKHLRVLEDARIVRSIRTGRESRFELDPAPIREVREYAEVVSQQWDQALSRLKSFVED